MSRFVASLNFIVDDGALVIQAVSITSAAEKAVMAWLLRKRFSVSSVPVDILVQPAGSGSYYRFRCLPREQSWVLTELRACGECGCTDDRACDPPCSWAAKHLCSACVPANKKEAAHD